MIPVTNRSGTKGGWVCTQQPIYQESRFYPYLP
jgi:hypothetical protein